MYKSDRSIKEIISEYGVKKGLDVLESLGIISKSGRKWWSAKRRGCSNGKDTMFCFICSDLIYGRYIYGKRECKSYRKHHNMKVGLFFSNEELVSNILKKYMKNP